MMANYFGKVSLVFFKAKNALFHAAALVRLFTLVKEQKKAVTSEELERFVLYFCINDDLFCVCH